MSSSGDAGTTEKNRPDSDEPLFTISEAARACGVSVKTIRRYIEKGKVDAWREEVSGGIERWRMTQQGLMAAGLVSRVISDFTVGFFGIMEHVDSSCAVGPA